MIRQTGSVHCTEHMTPISRVLQLARCSGQVERLPTCDNEHLLSGSLQRLQEGRISSCYLCPPQPLCAASKETPVLRAALHRDKCHLGCRRENAPKKIEPGLLQHILQQLGGTHLEIYDLACGCTPSRVARTQRQRERIRAGC